MTNGDAVAQRVKAALAPDGDPNAVCGPHGERPLQWLLDWHYERPLVEQLLDSGADTAANDADRLAIALCAGRLDDARAIVATSRDAARSANPEEARLLADLAGRDALDAERQQLYLQNAELLLDAGAAMARPDRLLDDASEPMAALLRSRGATG